MRKYNGNMAMAAKMLGANRSSLDEVPPQDARRARRSARKI